MVGVRSGCPGPGIETGIDPSIRLLEMEKSRGITGFLVRREERFLEDETFASRLLIVTLCFVESPLAVLWESYRVLKRGGKIALAWCCEKTVGVHFTRPINGKDTVSTKTPLSVATRRWRDSWSKLASPLRRFFQPFPKSRVKWKEWNTHRRAFSVTPALP